MKKPDLKKLKKRIPQSQAFKLGMWWRIFYGMLRIISGIAIIKYVNLPFQELVNEILNHQFIETTFDATVATINTFLVTYPITITYFVPVYLIFWGLVDVVLSVNLLKHNLWAFPVGLWLIGFFATYELISFYFTHSPFLLALLFIDAITFFLIRNEYVYTLGQMNLVHDSDNQA